MQELQTNMAIPNYNTIPDPYDSSMDRQVVEYGVEQLNDNNLESEPGSDDASATDSGVPPVKDEFDLNEDAVSQQNMTDLWIKNWIKSTNYQPKKRGFYIDGRTGYAEFIDVYVAGTIAASLGTIGGFSIGSDYIRDSANSFGLASTVSGSDDVRFWAGATFANRATAPFRVTEAGVVTISSAVVTGTLSVSSLTITSGSFFLTKNGNTTHDNSTTGTQAIPHGFGRTPVTVKIISTCSPVSNVSPNLGFCTYTVATDTIAMVYIGPTANSTTPTAGSSSTQAILVRTQDNTDIHAEADITCDDTNIYLEWTKTGAITTTTQIAWEVSG